MKKPVSLFLGIILLFSLCASVSAAGLGGFEKTHEYTEGRFTDVPADSWYAANVRIAYEYGIMNGTTATLFSPDGNVTIIQTIIMACRLHNLYYDNEAVFVGGNQAYVDYALEQGIISGEYADYGIPISRAVFATILGASLPNVALPTINTVADGVIPDVDVGADYYASVYRLYRAGILTGNDGKGTFTPSSNITRAAAAAIVGRMANPSLRKSLTLDAPAFDAVPIDKLVNLKSIQKNASDAEFAKAYNAALTIVAPYAGMSREDQLYGIAAELRQLAENGMEYSASAPHRDDPYGYFVQKVSSSAGAARTVGLCLNILAIPYEHVNEDTQGHQWCRVKVGSEYWICDAYGLYCGPEPAPYEHPYL